MKKLFAALLFLLVPASAVAGVPCTLPFTLTNGTLADATQVMADYNALVTCLANAASAGANSDITSLGGLTTPLSPTQGGSPVFVGTNTSTGSANAQVVSSTLPSSFSLTPNYKIVFKAGFTNGPGATQFNIAGTGLVNVFRRTTDGISALTGGEIILNSIVEAVYDGTQFQLMSNVSPFPVGTVLETVAAVADPGFLLLNNSCQSTTTFAALWVKMGSPGTGGCTAGQFALPDGRGRVIAQIDSGGSGRINVAGGNFDGTVLFNSGGTQSSTLGIANLPNSSLSVTVPQSPTASAIQASSGAAGIPLLNQNPSGGQLTATSSFSLGSTSSINGNQAQTAFTNLPPVLMLNRQIKY